jgi:hypothetical protein
VWRTDPREETREEVNVKTDSNTADDDLPPLSPEEEAAMQAEIELALEPYRKIAPARLIPTLREELERALRTHPFPRQLLRAFAPRTPVAASGESPVAGSENTEAKAGGKDGA